MAIRGPNQGETHGAEKVAVSCDPSAGQPGMDISVFCGRFPWKAKYRRPWVQDGYECAGDGLTFAFRRTTRPDSN